MHYYFFLFCLLLLGWLSTVREGQPSSVYTNVFCFFFWTIAVHISRALTNNVAVLLGPSDSGARLRFYILLRQWEKLLNNMWLSLLYPRIQNAAYLSEVWLYGLRTIGDIHSTGTGGFMKQNCLQSLRPEGKLLLLLLLLPVLHPKRAGDVRVTFAVVWRREDKSNDDLLCI